MIRKMLVLLFLSGSLHAQNYLINLTGQTKAQILAIVSGETIPNKTFFDDKIGQSFVDLVDASEAMGILAGSYTNLSTAISQANTDTQMVVVHSRFNITATARDTLKSDAAIFVRNGGRINLTRELLIQGDFTAGAHQVFEGNKDSVRFANIDKVNALWWPEDTTGLKAAIGVANRSGASLFIPGDYTIDDNYTITNSSEIIFSESASFTISSGKTLTIDGPINAANIEIFFGSGSVKTTERNLNVTWFDGASFDARWDFLTRGLSASDFYNITINQPYKNQNGAIELSPHGWLWDIDSPVTFNDEEQNVKFISKSAFTANSSIASAFDIGTTDKVNNIEFPLGLKILGNNNVRVGLKIGGVARLKFDGILAIHDADTLVYINNYADNTSGIDIDNLYLVGYTNHGMVIHGGTFGSGRSVDDINFGMIECDGGDAGSGTFSKILGPVRSLRLNKMRFQDSFSANTSILFHIAVKHNPIYQLNFNDIDADVDTGFVVVDSSSAAVTKISDSVFSNVRVTSAKAVGRFSYIRDSEINAPSTNNSVIVTSDADDITINTGNGYNGITDTGTRTRVNGIGLNSGDPRSAGDWNSGSQHEGMIVFDTSPSGDDVPYIYRNGGWTLISSYLTDRFDQTIADDAVYSFSSPTTEVGIIRVLVSGQSSFSGQVGFWTASGFTGNTSDHGMGADMEVTTGGLSGTTGTDAKVTISVNQGTIYVENRSGASRVFKISVVQ